MRIPGSEPEKIAVVRAYQFAEVCELFLRADVPSVIEARFDKLKPQSFLSESETVVRTLSEHFGETTFAAFETYVFDANPVGRDRDEVERITHHSPLGAASPDRPIFVIAGDGDYSSCCHTRQGRSREWDGRVQERGIAPIL